MNLYRTIKYKLVKTSELENKDIKSEFFKAINKYNLLKEIGFPEDKYEPSLNPLILYNLNDNELTNPKVIINYQNLANNSTIVQNFYLLKSFFEDEYKLNNYTILFEDLSNSLEDKFKGNNLIYIFRELFFNEHNLEKVNYYEQKIKELRKNYLNILENKKYKIIGNKVPLIQKITSFLKHENLETIIFAEKKI